MRRTLKAEAAAARAAAAAAVARANAQVSPTDPLEERAKKLASRKPGDPHPFVDPATWDARAKRQLETARKVLAEEQTKAGASKAN